MATEMSVPVTFRGRQWNCHIGDTIRVFAPFVNHTLTTMMLQMNCYDCGVLEKEKVVEIEPLQPPRFPRFVHFEFGGCPEIATTL